MSDLSVLVVDDLVFGGIIRQVLSYTFLTEAKGA
jgi:hypothetical protein